MFAGQEHRADSDSGSQDVREYHFHSGFWNRVLSRSRSRDRSRVRRLFGEIGNWFSATATRQQLLHTGHDEHASGLHRRRGRKGWQRKDQRSNKSLGSSFLVCVIIACGLACSHRDKPQATFEHTYRAFLHGDLKQSQEEAGRECQRLRNSNPGWAWKFRVLQAKSLLWRGMYEQALTLLNSPPTRPDDVDSVIEILTIEGVAYARLHQFEEAEGKLGQAEQICLVSSAATCGNMTLARGVLAVQRGQLGAAKQLFEQSLEFA